MPGKRGAKHGTLQGLTQAQAAAIVGISTATMSKWIRQGRFQLMQDGSVDPDDPQLVSKRGSKSNGKAGKEPSNIIDYYQQRARYEKAKADEKEFDLKVKHGQYIDAKRVQDTAVAIYLDTRERLDDMVETCAQLIASKFSVAEPGVRAILSEHVHEVQEKLADDIEANTYE